VASNDIIRNGRRFVTDMRLPNEWAVAVSALLLGVANLVLSGIVVAQSDPENGGSGSGEIDSLIGARPDGMPESVARALREIGPRIAGPETVELYAPLHPLGDEKYEGIAVSRDVRYANHERTVLDVFARSGNGTDNPVVVFVHGGGFRGGNKSSPGSPFYDNVMLWAVDHGFVGVNINYRLAPGHTWPSGIEDLTAVIEWIERNIAFYGGSADRIFLWGHSAGAAHVADYLANGARFGVGAKVAGAILTSGFYDLGDEVSPWEIYYGSDVGQYAARSSLPGLIDTDVPLMVVDAELDDPILFRAEADKLTEARIAAGKVVHRVHLPNHSHLSEVYAIGTEDRSLSEPVKAFVDKYR